METFYTSDRSEWRAYLSEHFETLAEIWFVFPLNGSGEPSLSYNDAVEEALCFGWIDSTNRRLDESHCARRFTPRKKGSPYFCLPTRPCALFKGKGDSGLCQRDRRRKLG